MNVLKGFDHIEVKNSETEIVVSKDIVGSFKIRIELLIHSGQYQIYFDRWSTKIKKKQDVINMVLFGLSAACRVRVVKWGSKTFEWGVESLKNGKWNNINTKRKLLKPFWKAKEILYLQNN